MIVQTIYGVAAGVIISFWVLVLDRTLFAWHPTFMTLGFLGFMTLGVVRSITFRPVDGRPRVKAIQVHALLQVGAVACITLGLAAIIQNKVCARLKIKDKYIKSVFCFVFQPLVIHIIE